MVSFSSSDLERDFINSIKTLSFLSGYIDGIEFNDFLNHNNDYDNDNANILIDEYTNVCLCIGDETPIIDVKQFIKMASEKSQMKINNAQSYATSKFEAYFLLNVHDYGTSSLLGSTFLNRPEEKPLSILEKISVINGKTYHISLFNGFCIYHLLLEESGDFDEYYSSYSSLDYFVRIQCEDEISMSDADSLASAYVFELQTAFDIRLPFSTGRNELDSIIDRGNESLMEMESRLFPLITGVGASELLKLYNNALNAGDLDFRILGYTKVIEYIAPTVSKNKLIESITLKLTSPEVFKPTSSFISELGNIYYQHQNNSTKDSELIKISVITAVTVDDIWEYVPSFLKNKSNTKPTEQIEQRNLLEKVADCIYNTRSEIAHAKANYEKKRIRMSLIF